MGLKRHPVRDFLYNGGNKIFAVSFAGLAFACFIAFYIYEEIASGWIYFRSSPLQAISFFVVFYTYLTILICNIRNDTNVYQGMLTFIFYIAFSALINSLTSIPTYLFSSIFGGGLSWALEAGEAGVGIALYIFTRNYMVSSTNSFTTIRVLSIVFASILSIYALIEIVYFALIGFPSLTVFLLSCMGLSEAFIGISIVFTLNRLERI